MSGRSEPLSSSPSARMARRSSSQLSSEFREVVVEAEVQHAVGAGRAAAQGGVVLQRPAVDRGAHRGEGGGTRIGAGEAGDAVAGGDQVGNDGGADEAGGACDEYTHEQFSRVGRRQHLR